MPHLARHRHSAKGLKVDETLTAAAAAAAAASGGSAVGGWAAAVAVERQGVRQRAHECAALCEYLLDH